MPNQPRKSKLENSRYEIVFDSRAWPKPSLPEWKTLAERGGNAFGDAYARIAGSFLDWFERLEDESAERKFRQRARGKEQRVS